MKVLKSIPPEGKLKTNSEFVISQVKHCGYPAKLFGSTRGPRKRFRLPTDRQYLVTFLPRFIRLSVCGTIKPGEIFTSVSCIQARLRHSPVFSLLGLPVGTRARLLPSRRK